MIIFLTVLLALVALNVILLIFSVNRVQPSKTRERNYILKVDQGLSFDDLEYSSLKKAV